MRTSTRFGILFPNLDRSDTADIPRDMDSIVAGIERSAMSSKGTLAARPAFGIADRYYYATDAGVFYYDTGAAWVPVSTPNTTIATSILLSGAFSAKPAPSAANTGYYYYATDNGKMHRSDGSSWIELFATALANQAGTLAARPSSASQFAGTFYFATDINGGTLYRNTGAAWVQVAAPTTQADSGGNIAAAGTIAVTNKFHSLTGTGTVDTINFTSPSIGQELTLVVASGAGPITFRDTVGNLVLQDRIHCTLVAYESITFQWYGSSGWVEKTRSPRYLTGQEVTLAHYTSFAGLAFEDGSAISRTSWAALFAYLGTSHGVGNGTTTFNIPDSRGRTTFGNSPSGHADVDTVGKTDGAGQSVRRVKHNHTVVNPTVANHKHGGGVHSHNLHRETKDLEYFTSGSPGTFQTLSMLPSGGGSPTWDAGYIQDSAETIALESPGTSGGTVGPQSPELQLTDMVPFIVKAKYIRV